MVTPNAGGGFNVHLTQEIKSATAWNEIYDWLDSGKKALAWGVLFVPTWIYDVGGAIVQEAPGSKYTHEPVNPLIRAGVDAYKRGGQKELSKFYLTDVVPNTATFGGWEGGKVIDEGVRTGNWKPFKDWLAAEAFQFAVVGATERIGAKGSNAKLQAARERIAGQIKTIAEGAETLTNTLDGASRTPNKPNIFRKQGGFEQANKDFDALVKGSPVEPLPGTPDGRIATIGKGHRDLPNGTLVNVRPKSSLGADRSGGQPTIEVQDPEGNVVKIRYD
jgi:hypothetical protein